jgi:hypothetical protein
MIRPSLRRGPGQAAPRSCKDDDTGLDYYDTPAGNIGHPRRAGQQARGDAPGGPRPFRHRPPQRALSQNSRPEQDYYQTWRKI